MHFLLPQGRTVARQAFSFVLRRRALRGAARCRKRPVPGNPAAWTGPPALGHPIACTAAFAMRTSRMRPPALRGAVVRSPP